MPIRIAIPKEITNNERRVAVSPEVVTRLAKLDVEVLVESGAGGGAYIADEEYKGATMVASGAELYAQADVVFKIQPPTDEEIAYMQAGTVLIGAMLPNRCPEHVKTMRDHKITCFATELIPRITRAQAMDTLSSQSAVAGYKGVLLAADLCPKFFPMLTTAAGTVRPAKVLIIGAGVAGLQAIATAKRLGAVVEAYDIRPETKEQCESLGAKFVDTGISAEGEGGYARELTDSEKLKQKALLDEHISRADCVITTAALPGRPAPKIIDVAAVESMRPGAVIIDLAAEGGGNCEVSKAGETVVHDDVLVHAPVNVASTLPVHASEMFAKNLLNFITPHIKDGKLEIDWDDEIITASCLTHDGEIRHQGACNYVEEHE